MLHQPGDCIHAELLAPAGPPVLRTGDAPIVCCALLARRDAQAHAIAVHAAQRSRLVPAECPYSRDADWTACPRHSTRPPRALK